MQIDFEKLYMTSNQIMKIISFNNWSRASEDDLRAKYIRQFDHLLIKLFSVLDGILMLNIVMNACTVLKAGNFFSKGCTTRALKTRR
jgi:hypothetical protein